MQVGYLKEKRNMWLRGRNISWGQRGETEGGKPIQGRIIELAVMEEPENMLSRGQKELTFIYQFP